MEGSSHMNLIVLCVVALVALIAVMLVLKGGATGAATKIFSTSCFDFCKDRMCKGINMDDRAKLYPCINSCLNDCWQEYTLEVPE